MSSPPRAREAHGVPRTEAVVIIGVGLASLAAAFVIPVPEMPPKLHLFAFAGIQCVILLVGPLVFARLVLRRGPASFGLCLGVPRLWLRDVGRLALLALPLLVLLSRVPAIRSYYPIYAFVREEHWLLLPSTIAFGLYGFAWEFLFRGFLQLGTRPALGRVSILVQWLPFVLAHMYKPPIEMVLTVVSGLVLGALTDRHSTMLPAWLLHFGASTTLNVLCLIP